MNLEIFDMIGIPMDWFLIGTMAVVIIMFIMLITTMVKLSRMKKNYNTFMSGKDGQTLEDAIIRKFSLLEILDESVKEIYAHIKSIDENLLYTYQKMGFKKYDAFKEVGGRMSFVLVLLTKENNGIILNCMHSNADGCYTYAKRVEKGTCSLTLSNEEQAALEQAILNKTE